VYTDTDLPLPSLRKVLSELIAPLPASKGLPPVLVVSLAHLCKLFVGDLVAEAQRVQAKRQHQQQQQLGRPPAAPSSSSARHQHQHPAAHPPQQPLTQLEAASVQEAYHSLVSLGRIPSRLTAPTSGSGAPSAPLLPDAAQLLAEHGLLLPPVAAAAAAAAAVGGGGAAATSATDVASEAFTGAARPRRTRAWKR
jgi:hypothetical protein